MTATLLVALLGSVGAGLGLSVGLALNVRLARHVGGAQVASLVNFVVGALVTGILFLGITLFGSGGFADGAPSWAYLGGAVGAAFVSFTLLTARQLGVAASTAAVTFGQIAAARLIDTFGWLGQTQRDLRWTGLLGALLLLGAVVLLAHERARE